MGLEEEIQPGNLRLHKHEEERVWLRKKSALIYVEVKKMEDEIMKYFLGKNTRLVRQGMYDPDDRVKTYCHELISLMPWLGLHIPKHSDHGSTLKMVKCTMLTVTIKGGDSPETMMEDKMELYMGGATTWLAKGRTVLVL